MHIKVNYMVEFGLNSTQASGNPAMDFGGFWSSLHNGISTESRKKH